MRGIAAFLKAREGFGEGTAPPREAPRRGQVQEGERLLPFFVKGSRGRNGPAAVIQDRERGCADAAPLFVTGRVVV
jgi:hypothetical protein